MESMLLFGIFDTSFKCFTMFEVDKCIDSLTLSDTCICGQITEHITMEDIYNIQANFVEMDAGDETIWKFNTGSSIYCVNDVPW